MAINLEIDLDAIISEAQRDTIPLILGGKTYDLPAELPLDVFGPFLSLDVSDVLADIVAVVDKDKSDEKFASVVIDALFERPDLPIDMVKAAGEAAKLLLGEEAYAAFWAARPGLKVMRGFWKELSGAYSVTLLDFFGSSDSSESTGDQSQPTSSGSTDSTPEPSSDAPATPEGSSASDGS